MKNSKIGHNRKITHNNIGIVLLFTLVMMITISSVVGAYLGFVQFSTKSVGGHISGSQAMYLAEAGINYGIYNLKQNPAWAGTPSGVPLGEGIFSVSVTNLGTGGYRLISTGTVDNQSRTAQQDLTSTGTPKPDTWKEI